MERISFRTDMPGLTIASSINNINVPPEINLPGRIIFLVHGYQNSDKKALASFTLFERQLRVAANYRPAQVVGRLCGLYWPGNHSNAIASVLTFNARIEVAHAAGRLLADIINKECQLCSEVVLVGHSLGCAVVLYALMVIREMNKNNEYKGPKITHSFLLAAAVPENMCRTGKEPYGIRSPDDLDEHVFFSSHDLALKKIPYGVGEWSWSGLWSSAVGTEGGAKGRWPEANRHPSTNRHGQYWSSYSVAADIVKAIGFSPVGRLAARSIAERDSFAGAWERRPNRNLMENHGRERKGL